MIVSVAAFMVSATASMAAQLSTPSLPEVFIAACLNGEARLSADQAARRSFDELPASLRQRLGTPTSGDIWQLNTPGRAYLYVLNYEARPGTYPKICGLASDRMHLKEAADPLDLRLAGSVQPERRRGMQWLRPEDGYDAIATTAADFKVVQINWLNERDRAAAIQELRKLPR